MTSQKVAIPVLLALAIVATAGCTSSPSGTTQWGGDKSEYLAEIKDDPLVGPVFADGANDDGAIDIAEAICGDLQSGGDLIGISIFMNETYGWSVEVATQLAITANLYYCPELDPL